MPTTPVTGKTLQDCGLARRIAVPHIRASPCAPTALEPITVLVVRLRTHHKCAPSRRGNKIHRARGRKNELHCQGIYDFDGLDSTPDVRGTLIDLLRPEDR